MNIMVSFCNLRWPGRPALGLLDSLTSAFHVLPLPPGIPRGYGITGLAASEAYVYALLQEPAGLLVFDRTKLGLLNHYPLRSAADAHSLWVSDEALYIVSTGTDEVIELQMRQADVVSERVFWRPDPEAPRADIHHLNAIYGWRGELLVSGFGKKTGPLWSSAVDGFVQNLTRGHRIASGLQHPHSLLATDGAVACCESRKRAVRIAGDTRVQYLSGYTRGLCSVGQKLFVGTSKGRKVSKSTGTINQLWVQEKPGDPTGTCAVSRLDLESFEIEHTVDLGDYGDEIYDLLAVDNTDEWPRLSAAEFRPVEATCEYQTQLACREITSVVPPQAAFILVDADQWGTSEEIEGRRRIPFLERDGQYWGPPPDDDSAIEELERLRRCGAGFIAFGWSTFWWLDHYPRFHSYLRSRYRRIRENERLIMFDLRT